MKRFIPLDRFWSQQIPYRLESLNFRRHVKTITADEIIVLGPCWIHDGRTAKLRELVGDGVTYRQIATDERVSLADRRWVLTNLASRTDDGRKALVRWAAEQAQSVLYLITSEAHRTPCETAISTAIAWTEARANGEECRSAAYAAYDAAYAAANAAAYDAAYAAANAAYAAAYAAVADAGTGAATAAASAASAAANAANAAVAAAASAANAQKALVALATSLEELKPEIASP